MVRELHLFCRNKICKQSIFTFIILIIIEIFKLNLKYCHWNENIVTEYYEYIEIKTNLRSI